MTPDIKGLRARHQGLRHAHLESIFWRLMELTQTRHARPFDGGCRLHRGRLHVDIKALCMRNGSERSGAAPHQWQVRLAGLVAKACGAVWPDVYARGWPSGKGSRDAGKYVVKLPSPHQ